MELPSLEESKPILANVYLQLKCSGIDCNYLFKSFPALFSNALITLLLVILISHKLPLTLEDAALRLFLYHLFMHIDLWSVSCRS